VLLGRSLGHEQSAAARSAAQHCQWRWLGASLFVVLYSWLISMSVPYFSSLVGIVASSTYLVSEGCRSGRTVYKHSKACFQIDEKHARAQKEKMLHHPAKTFELFCQGHAGGSALSVDAPSVNVA
jgi:hypothetical protein